MYKLRAFGGTLYVTGIVLMLVNLYRTAKSGKFVPEQEAQAPALRSESHGEKRWTHRWLEGIPVTFTVLATLAVLIGGLVEIVPMFLIKSNVPTIANVKPYTPLGAGARHLYP